MHPAFENGGGTKVGEQELAIPKARQLAALLARGLPFVKLLHFERQQSSGVEAAVIQVEVELGQKSVHPIQRFEPLAFLFDPKDELGQTVLALREGFPITPHQRISPRSEPRTLCLHEEPYAEQKLRWSPFALIERARDWLRLTARGELHQDDQPLEPLLATAEVTAILPHDFYESLASKDLIPMAAARFEDLKNLFAVVVPQPQWQKMPNAEFILSPFLSPPVEHGIITHQPTNLLQLHQFCQSVSLDLLKELRDRIRTWKIGANSRQFSNSKLILCVIFPKLRRAEGQPESRETWLFITRATLQELATCLGVLDSKTINGFAGVIIGNPEVRTEGADKVEILPMRPTFILDRQSASMLNGTAPTRTKIAAIGLGALGSQIFDNLLRSGFGTWTLIDKDFLLPHNCARHALEGSAVPLAKAEAMRARAIGMVADVPVQAILADILNPADKAEQVHTSIDAADVILDMSASVAVSKHLALDLKAQARRASAFLNPSGDTLVLLIEDQARTTPLDWLETQYYAALTANETFTDHFKSPGRFRYSRSCGDISGRISQDLISLHAATASRALRAGFASPAPMLLLCRAQPDFSTKSHAPTVNQPLVESVAGWTILTNRSVIVEAHRLRHAKLPSETGGALLGSVDVAHQRIYVTGLLPSPRDSKEWPNLYIRGAAGLRNRVQEISNATADNVGYIGEWHSHPPRSSPNASPTDRVALSKLADEMSLASLPALMLIIADSNRHQYHIFAGRRANGDSRKRQRKTSGALSCL